MIILSLLKYMRFFFCLDCHLKNGVEMGSCLNCDKVKHVL
jgi:hypothetical protein